MSNSSRFNFSNSLNWTQRIRELAPGFTVSLVAAAAATFLSEHYAWD